MKRPSTGALLVLAAMSVVFIIEGRTLLAMLGIHVSWTTGAVLGTLMVSIVFAWALLGQRDSSDDGDEPNGDSNTQPISHEPGD